MQRTDKRKNDQLRDVSITPDFNMHAEGSALIKFGNTHVVCNATIEKATPRWMQNDKRGWITAEYGMLPRSTNERMNREANRGKQSGRTMEIQRLIGRSLRQVVDLTKLTGYTITIDCDVIQADGGTRTASITGGTVALCKALKKIGKKTHIETSGAYPLTGIWDWVCLSPKKAKLPIEDVYNHAHELKIIIYNNHDFKFAEQEAKKVNKNAININLSLLIRPLILYLSNFFTAKKTFRFK